MSIKLICKSEFFHRRLNSQLGLNITVEPGTTYFLCSGLEEVPTLVSSQDPNSLTALSNEKKVQILICKERSNDVKTSWQPLKSEPGSATSMPEEKSLSQTVKQIKEKTHSYVGVVKSSSTCSVTSTSDQYAKTVKESCTTSVGTSKVEAPVIKLPLHALCNYSSESPTGSKSEITNIALTPNQTKLQDGSVLSGIGGRSDLPCQALRHELKQAILQRRMSQGKTMIDLMKEENERQMALQNMKMSDDEIEKMIKRRVSNNRAARKCREKRKMEEENLMLEVKRLRERKHSLTAIISSLEQQQKFLRLWASGSDVDDSASKEMLKAILNSEVQIPEFPQESKYKIEDLSDSITLSSSVYHLDDTKNRYELDSSQDTNETSDLVSHGYSEVEEISNSVSSNTDDNIAGGLGKGERYFGHIKSEETYSDNDSDVELIEIERPLVIDVN